MVLACLAVWVHSQMDYLFTISYCQNTLTLLLIWLLVVVGIAEGGTVCISISFKATEHYNCGLKHILTNYFLFSLVFPPHWSSQRGFSCPAPLEPSIMLAPTHHNRPPHFWPKMELKVWVDGVQRVVCGVTEATTCQEVVIALAQAIGGSFSTIKAQMRNKQTCFWLPCAV